LVAGNKAGRRKTVIALPDGRAEGEVQHHRKATVPFAWVRKGEGEGKVVEVQVGQRGAVDPPVQNF